MRQEPVVPGAEAFSFEGGPAGVLLLHGFTGNPSSMRPLGEWLSARGHAVECPRYPGHGTHWRDLGRYRWQDWAREAEAALDGLLARTGPWSPAACPWAVLWRSASRRTGRKPSAPS